MKVEIIPDMTFSEIKIICLKGLVLCRDPRSVIRSDLIVIVKTPRPHDSL